MKPWKRVLAMILTLCLMSTALPAVPALAVEGEPAEETVQPDYAVTHLTVRGTSATVELTAPGDCALVVALYTEGGSMISTVMEKVSGDAEPQTVPVTIDPKEHTVYTAKAFLLDGESYAPLGETAEEGYAPWAEVGDIVAPTQETIAFSEETNLHYATNTLIIIFDPDATVFEINEVVESVGGEIIGQDGVLKIYQVCVAPSSFEELQTLAAQVTEWDCVSFASYDAVFLSSACSVTAAVPDDPWEDDVNEYDWRDSTVDGSNWWVEAIDGQYAWAYQDKMEHINIGIVDNSFDVGHEDLKNKVKFADALMEQRNNASKSNHGTHVAGIIGAEANNDKGIAGLVNDATLLLAPAPNVNVGQEESSEGDSFAEIYTGISHVVAAGAKVVNLSVGMSEGITETRTSYGAGVIETLGTFSAIWMAQLLDEVGDFVLVQAAGNGDVNHKAVDAIENGYFCLLRISLTRHPKPPPFRRSWTVSSSLVLRSVETTHISVVTSRIMVRR